MAVNVLTISYESKGTNKAVYKFHLSCTDGADDTGADLIDITAQDSLGWATCKVNWVKAWGTLGMAILWEATSDKPLFSFGASGVAFVVNMDFRKFGGLRNDAGTGVTGDLVYTTLGSSTAEATTIIMELQKES